MTASQEPSLPLDPLPPQAGMLGQLSPPHIQASEALSAFPLSLQLQDALEWGLRAGEPSPCLLLEVDVSGAASPHSALVGSEAHTAPSRGDHHQPPAMFPCPVPCRLLAILSTQFPLPGQPSPGLWQLTCVFTSEERSVKEGLVWRKCWLFFPPL